MAQSSISLLSLALSVFFLFIYLFKGKPKDKIDSSIKSRTLLDQYHDCITYGCKNLPILIPRLIYKRRTLIAVCMGWQFCISP